MLLVFFGDAPALIRSKEEKLIYHAQSDYACARDSVRNFATNKEPGFYFVECALRDSWGIVGRVSVKMKLGG